MSLLKGPKASIEFYKNWFISHVLVGYIYMDRLQNLIIQI